MQKETFPLTAWAFFEPKSSHWLTAKVPGCIHNDLLHKRIPDPFWGSNERELQWIEEEDWNYRCRFAVKADFCNYEHIELVAEGLDTVASIRLNGENIGWTENMFVAHRFDVKQALRPGRNILEIRLAALLPTFGPGANPEKRPNGTIRSGVDRTFEKNNVRLAGTGDHASRPAAFTSRSAGGDGWGTALSRFASRSGTKAGRAGEH